MNIKRYLLATLTVFVFFFFYEWAVHGFMLSDLYQSTESVWRSEDEMMSLFPLTVLWQLLVAVVVTLIYVKYVKPGIYNGLIFGILWGIVAGLMWTGIYPYLPIPSTLAMAWFFSSLIEGIGAGLILGAIYRRTKA